jgi:hypothetical protein
MLWHASFNQQFFDGAINYQTMQNSERLKTTALVVE